MIATFIDGLIFGAAYVLLALPFGDIRVVGEAANWDANLSAGWNIAYGLLVAAYYAAHGALPRPDHRQARHRCHGGVRGDRPSR